ncbi:hypothetical protein GWK47_016401 [Chionoecetes opilio]|uniref:Uncharacterized protein n=1 Tax=Chionoecetes opilio TaxID=41210 RepID=A0A8J4XUF5_CHIOP|nr:hypothetical protein GWK47_016401 [Chionoecetes opilio]
MLLPQQITILTPYKAPKVHQNVREVVLPDMDLATFSPNMFTNRMMGPISMAGKAPMMCCDALGRQETQNMLKEKYDLIMLSMFFSECFLSVVHQMKIRNVIKIHRRLSEDTGIPVSPTLNANRVPALRSKITVFFIRLMDLEEWVAGAGQDGFIYFSLGSAVTPSDIPEDVKTLEVPAQPSVPTTIYCGGIHCRPSEPLPKVSFATRQMSFKLGHDGITCEDFRSGGVGGGCRQDGFIYFSLGSAVTPSDMPEEHRKILVECLGHCSSECCGSGKRTPWRICRLTCAFGKWPPNSRTFWVRLYSEP